jgi:hypothetical protein
MGSMGTAAVKGRCRRAWSLSSVEQVVNVKVLNLHKARGTATTLPPRGIIGIPADTDGDSPVPRYLPTGRGVGRAGVMCVKFSKMVVVADVVAPVGNAAALSTGVVHATLRRASFLSS